MNEQRRQLLCTFSSISKFREVIEEIKKRYAVCNDRFFVFTNKTSQSEVFITYNILIEQKELPHFSNTIFIDRKKQTNTLYTLNAMNEIIKINNGGSINKEYSVNWEMYRNALIITNESDIRTIPIKLLEIVSSTY
jgi:hypothetical protein